MGLFQTGEFKDNLITIGIETGGEGGLHRLFGKLNTVFSLMVKRMVREKKKKLLL
jgi:hypothetical protein